MGYIGVGGKRVDIFLFSAFFSFSAIFLKNLEKKESTLSKKFRVITSVIISIEWKICFANFLLWLVWMA
jgi:hypothetical protein